MSGGKYESQMTLLVRANRAEIVVTPGQTADNTRPLGLNEGQIATEVQLITSRSSLRQVVERCKLAEPGAETDLAVEALGRDLKVTPMPKASMIEVRYSHSDPKKAAEVLREVLATYTDQHLRVHKGAGTDFFQQQSGDQATRLREAQQRLAAFQRDTKIVMLAEQKSLNLRRLMELESNERESRVALQEGQQRITALQQMAASLSPRITTQVRKSPNNFLVERLNTMLVELENKRTDLLSKFRSDDRLVRQVEQQIADTRTTLDRATKMESTEQASDVNPLRQSLDGDLARARMTQNGLKARIQALGVEISSYKQEIAKLEQATAPYTDLVREVKTLEDNYQLYARKWEESRIADALDRQKIANITVVEQPEVPSAPMHRSLIMPIGTVLLGLCLILFAAVLTGLHGQELHTPQAIFEASGIQVLATLPEMRRTR